MCWYSEYYWISYRECLGQDTHLQGYVQLRHGRGWDCSECIKFEHKITSSGTLKSPELRNKRGKGAFMEIP